MNALAAPFVPPLPSGRILRPGFGDGGHERYSVPGAQGLCLLLAAGDALTVSDPEGLQPAVLIVTDAQGTPAAQALHSDGTRHDPRALVDWLNSADPRATALHQRLMQRGLNLQIDAAFACFDGAQAAGSTVALLASTACNVWVVAPAHVHGVHGFHASTELRLQVTRRHNVDTRPGIKGRYRLPDPLGDARLDFQVDRCTAKAYLIRRGEFVQVIDPYGRQCTDFIAFRQQSLDRGVERFVDATVSRSLTRTSYPLPGLLDKFYDQDMRPLLRVVQDTCGRHDTFALACTRRGYEDSGYPGHQNCSDNISAAAAPYGVTARSAWPAVNFFFNTSVTAHNAIVSDEGWSRPGDFVLMQAEDDLLCVSTACPDDTTPINGWNPTDVHVRVYPAGNPFKTSMAYRMTPDAEPVMTRETGFHARTSALTRHYRVAREYFVPTQFTDHGAQAEYAACRSSATLMDMSQLCKFDVSGPDAETLLQRTMTRDIRKMAVGQVLYSLLCYPHGGMLDDGTLFRLGQATFRWVCGNPLDGPWLRDQARELGLDAFVRTATHDLHNLSLQGPQSREILQAVLWTPDTQPRVSELKWFRSLIGRVANREGPMVLASRTGFTGELGFELFCSPPDGPLLWDALCNAGAAHGLTPMGSNALEMLRVEAGLVVGGNEFSSETDPFEAGVGFAVAADKSEDYVGHQAIERARAHPKRSFVGLQFAGSEVPAHGDGIYVGNARVGAVTSAVASPHVGAPIALARVAPEYAALGTALEVGRLDGSAKRLPCVVRPAVFYDPEKRRVRA
jgi:aminomethyltransferase